MVGQVSGSCSRLHFFCPSLCISRHTSAALCLSRYIEGICASSANCASDYFCWPVERARDCFYYILPSMMMCINFNSKFYCSSMMHVGLFVNYSWLIYSLVHFLPNAEDFFSDQSNRSFPLNDDNSSFIILKRRRLTVLAWIKLEVLLIFWGYSRIN